jgi:hypothetical protein
VVLGVQTGLVFSLTLRALQSTQVYIHIERAIYLNGTEGDFHVKVASTKGGIAELIEAGFGHILQKRGRTYFRKSK